MWSKILDFLFPRRCVSCGKLGAYLCPACVSKITYTKTPVCPVCERPAIGGATHPGCQTRYALDGLISVAVYEGPIKVAIKRLKYKPWISDMAEKLTEIIVSHLKQNLSIYRYIDKKPAVVPVPLYKKRERERGFNQAALLGKLLAEKLNLEFCPDFLIRQKNTKPQVELKGEERQENIKDAFVINRNSIRRIGRRNSKFLLIDDVWTTGATLRSCGNVLKRAGFKNVWALTLAR